MELGKNAAAASSALPALAACGNGSGNGSGGVKEALLARARTAPSVVGAKVGPERVAALAELSGSTLFAPPQPPPQVAVGGLARSHTVAAVPSPAGSTASPATPVRERLPLIRHSGAFWEVRHGALRIQLTWRSFSATATSAAQRWRRRGKHAGTSSEFFPAMPAQAAPAPAGASPKGGPRPGESEGSSSDDQMGGGHGGNGHDGARPARPKRDDDWHGGGADDGVMQAAKTWLVMEKVMEKLPSQAADDDDDTGSSSTGAGGGGGGGGGGPAARVVSFSEELYCNGRVVGTVTGELHLLDTPKFEQLHHGTLTEGGIAFTGPLVIGGDEAGGAAGGKGADGADGADGAGGGVGGGADGARASRRC